MTSNISLPVASILVLIAAQTLHDDVCNRKLRRVTAWPDNPQ